MASSIALRCLNEAIDAAGVPRKVIAADCLGVSEAQFSKLTSGQQAFSVAHLDRLPDPVRVGFLTRYGKSVGCDVRELSVPEINQALLALVGQVAAAFQQRQLCRPMRRASDRAELVASMAAGL